MASGSVWGVDLGKSSLKAVRMRRGKEELEVQTLAYYEYTAAEDGSIPPSEPSRALEQLIADHPVIKRERVIVALPGHASFNRFVKLPAFDPKKIGEMVKFEAQQQIPFPIAEVNWDYALVEREYEEGEDREVGLFAIKKEVVYAFLGDLQLAGLEPDVITIEPLAIYNFALWDMELADQATVILDIGWDHTDLVIVDGDRYWIRNLALNGQDLTKAIATRLKVSFEEAEKLKREAAQAKENKKIYGATEVVLKDFVGQIQQSIGFYKKLNKDRDVRVGQVILLGSGSKLPNIRPFFQKELGYPVDTVKRLSRLALDVDVNPDEVELLKDQLPSFAVALGLGIQGCGGGANQINLLPGEIQQQKALERKKPLVAVAVALLYVLVVAAYVIGKGSVEKIDAVLVKANENLASLQRLEKSRAAETDIAPLEKRVARLASLVANRNLPLELLNKLAGVLPKTNAELAPLDDAQKKVLLNEGTKIAKVEKVSKDLEREQARKNDEKTWILDLKVKAVDGGGARATLLVARKFLRDAQNRLDEKATLDAIDTGLLNDIKRVLPQAGFDKEEAAKTLTALEKDAVVQGQAQTSSGWPIAAQARSDDRYLSVKIVIDYPGSGS
jgi:type IV pilus assembly protein PilM